MGDLCTACGAEVIWVKHARTGRPSPLDAEQTPDGNCELLLGGFYRIVPAAERARLQLHRSHFSTCPDADRFRGRSQTTQASA